MAFVLPRTSYHHPGHPRDGPQISAITTDMDISQTPHTNTATGPSTQDQHEMAKEKEHKPRIEILLDSPYLFLKGTAGDVEPTLLSGHVAIHLNDATPIKEITLQLRGKAHLPVPPLDSMSITPLTYIICTHDWSFLEGEKKSSHTLKAGRHLFPFHLRVGGTLPSSISSTILGGTDVSYNLRAQITRTGFAFNQTYTSSLPVFIIRSLVPDAMEYQQTLEIENTWPEKLMYSIMLPHKAWAAGDTITAVVKLSPLAKGVCVLHATTSIHEQIKLYLRSNSHEQTRRVASTKHEFANGHAVEVEDSHTRLSHSHGCSPPSTPSDLASSRPNRSQSSSSLSSLGRQYYSNTPVHGSAMSSTSTRVPANSLSLASSSDAHADDDTSDPDSSDVVVQLSIRIPLSATPTHNLEPISVSHRIRWNILILNMDGHTSELRCSLPIYLLDYRLLHESRTHTAATRRLLLGEAEIPIEEEESTQLPSYDQHVRDRVANMYFPDATTLRVSNPWVAQGTSPVQPPNAPYTPSLPTSSSGNSTPPEPHLYSHLPYQPDPSTGNTPLEWVNSELLLSLSNELPSIPPHPESGTDSEPSSRSNSQRHSRAHSLTRRLSHGHLGLSRFSSRAASPERHQHQHHYHYHHHPTNPITQISVASSHETYMHSGSQASRNTDSILRPTMKLSSSFSPSGWISSSRSSSTQHVPTLQDLDRGDTATTATSTTIHNNNNNARGSVPPPVRRAMSGGDEMYAGTELLHRAFTAVPDYGVASRGFIGGVPPLSSMRGLPSYDETVRTRSEGDLVRFARLAVAAQDRSQSQSQDQGSSQFMRPSSSASS